MAIKPGVLGVDCTFEMDHFQNPRLRNENEMIKNVLLMILFMKPGQYPSLPQLGLDLQQLLYSFYDELDEEELKQKIIDSCNALELSFNIGRIVVKKTMYRNRPSLIIRILTDTTDSWAESYVASEDQRTKRNYYIGITLNEMNDIIYNINELTENI